MFVAIIFINLIFLQEMWGFRVKLKEMIDNVEVQSLGGSREARVGGLDFRAGSRSPKPLKGGLGFRVQGA